jgi:DNA-binding NtrC family response regulator
MSSASPPRTSPTTIRSGRKLVRLYSKQEAEAARLRSLKSAAGTARQAGERSQQARQRHRRLSLTEVAELIKEYEQEATPVKDLARRFGIHRATVTALLQRHGVGLRQAGLAPEQIPAAAHLFLQGWS